jgi:hypothetical protein
MEQSLRQKQLKILSKSSQGQALKDWLEIEIAKLENVSLIPEENFEANARANKAAAKLLRKLFRFLEVAGIKTTEREKNQYI